MPTAPYNPPAIVNIADPITQTTITDAKAANTSPTLTDTALVTALSPNNTGLPVNAPVIVQKGNAVSTGNVASIAKAFTSNNTAGNTIIVVCGNGNNGTLTVADTAGNTYTKAILQANSTTYEAAIFYAVGIVAGANTVTVTNAGTAASMAIQVYEASGLLAQVVAQPDQSTSGTATATTTVTLSALAASEPNSLAFFGIAVGTGAAASSVTSGTNWTLDSTQNTTTPSGLYSFGALSQYLSSTTAVIPTATLGASEPYASVAAIFKPVAVSIAGTVQIGGYNYTHLAGTGTTLIKTGAGVLHSIVINTPVAGTLEADDALTNTTPVIAILTIGTATAMAPFSSIYDVAFSTGLTIKITTGAMDATIVWK